MGTVEKEGAHAMPPTKMSKWQCPARVAAVTFLLASSTMSEAALAEVGAPQFGWVEGECLVLKAPLDTLPRRVWIAPAKAGAEAIETYVIAPIEPDAPESARLCRPLQTENAIMNRSDAHRFYRLSRARPFEYAVAVLTPPEGGYTYGVCFTYEGVRATVRQDKRVIWEDTYFLSYDFEPDCR
ncbi:hypothetical protein [Erythrobacter sp. CCH5-A1]|jgi:hypothetical protein|uniref:hypothetical protein n=1 Tax=Erythrobacter sp. CCH5-A1 TaxID=1768792 RepID=UPI0012E35A3B|nr:hypothetical protein [Erythrobacter sp. CCH5-A1]